MAADATAPKKETNVAEAIGDGEETLAAIGGDLHMLPDDPFVDDIYDYNVKYANVASNESIRMYDWLADSGSTNHITNRRELFSSYEPTPEATVHGVGGKIIQVEGRGTVKLIAQYGTRKRTLYLEKVNYIPSNKYNILALGRWDSHGRRYQASNGNLILYDHDDVPVLKGQKINSNIYKFQLSPSDASNETSDKQYTFSCNESKQSWETWHRRFGHVSYTGLKKLLDERLLDGFTVDANTPTPDCISCTEAKQSVKPFGEKDDTARKNKGELTHIDLWGKYEISSLNGHQYYLLLVDDATRYVTVYFLKGKYEAAQHVKNYLTYLHVRGITTHAIRVDRGTEFVNKDLQDWCHTKGMEIQLTAPYSPSQNGIAERMNRTLVELARAMLTASKLPEFLWEPAVANAAYIRNRAYTTSIRDKTPYQAWNGTKPNVSHLREFGAPVWVLIQGQTVARKILPKSKRRAYVGYNDASKSVIYYNAETRKILTSRNYVFLTAKTAEPTEEIQIEDTPTREGERAGGNTREVEEQNTSRKRKRPAEEDEPRKTRGVRPNYRLLNDPYLEEEMNSEGEDKDESLTADVCTAEIGDEFYSLKEAKDSPDWPQWENAIRTELTQHQEKGTWELVEKPVDAIPLTNKWVFVKKRDKEGRIIKNKARLVVKGCGQRPGDYLETHSPVVRIESIRAILAIAVAKRLMIQQMDVKGAYLNGILKETLYMRQPEGFGDDSGRVCHLLRTLYGLKQSGREWNIEFDTKMQQ